MKEIYKNIKWNKNYQISNFGNVKMKTHFVNHYHGMKIEKERILKGCNFLGYLRVRIKGKPLLIHRLVAIHFIPNSNNKPHVNHLNGKRSDNNVNNLEWCTPSENSLHSYKFLGRKPNRKWFNKKCKYKKCSNIAKLLGWCRKHYMKHWQNNKKMF
jgi:hypothetical protein